MVTNTPQGTPLTFNEQLLAELKAINATLQVITQGQSGGGLTSTTQQQLQTVLAAQMPSSYALQNVISPSVSILARLMSNYLDYGVITQLGTATTIRDTNKYWQTNSLNGNYIFFLIGQFLYSSQITSNTNQIITFNTLAGDTQPPDGTIYWIVPVASNVLSVGTSFVTGQQSVAVAGTPTQLSVASVPVKPGTRITVLSKPGNAGVVYFANSAANCVTGTYFDGLNPGLAAAISEPDVSNIWIDVANDGDGASWYAEQ